MIQLGHWEGSESKGTMPVIFSRHLLLLTQTYALILIKNKKQKKQKQKKHSLLFTIYILLKKNNSWDIFHASILRNVSVTK